MHKREEKQQQLIGPRLEAGRARHAKAGQQRRRGGRAVPGSHSHNCWVGEPTAEAAILLVLVLGHLLVPHMHLLMLHHLRCTCTAALQLAQQSQARIVPWGGEKDMAAC